jgi:hypothetical protein
VVEPDSSVLDARRRIAAFIVLGAAVGTWYLVFSHFRTVGVWTAVAIIAAGVMPAMLGLVYIALPVSRIRWQAHVAVALGLGLVAFLCSETNQGLAGNFAKFWAAVFAGWAFLYLFYEVSLVVLIAVIIPFVDAISVFTPGAPTHEIIAKHPAVYTDVAVAFPASTLQVAGLGPPDILFFALFLAATLRFRLRPGWTWLAMTGMYSLTIVLTTAVDTAGLPALPFLSVGFLAVNADLLWKAVRKRA